MSIRTAGHQFDCSSCTIFDTCTKHICDHCGTCDGDILSFPACDFDLCPTCMGVLAASMGRGLVTLRQGCIISEDSETEEGLTIIRKSIPEDTRNAIFARDGDKCLFCGDTKDLCLDHIVAFSRGGTTSPDNLQTLCRSCNSKKGAR
jgi:hypothetical protein